MAFDQGLAERIRDVLQHEASISEQRMFGGLCFLSGGNMCFGIVGNELMVRVGPQAYDATVVLPHARVMDFTGRALRGMVYVGEDGLSEDHDLAAWLNRGLDFARSLPPK